MLDIQGLPKNANGFRTTHTCELCGFEPKTKNKYREKQDHLVMKHFKEKIDKIFPHCRPYSCPSGDCPFSGKDKQALLRHYTGKHGILERYLREALAEKGIHYAPGEGGKRRSSANSDGSGNGRAKNARLSVTPPNGIVQLSPSTPVAMTIVDAPNHNGITLNGKNGFNGTCTKLALQPAHKPNTEELRKEVEAMMASFQPVEQPVVLHIPPPASVNGFGRQTSCNFVTTAKGELVNGIPLGVTQVVTAIPVMSSCNPTANGGTVVATAPPAGTANGGTSSVHNGHGVIGNGQQHIPITSLPAIVLSAVASATVASVQAKTNRQQLHSSVMSSLLNGASVIATSSSLVIPNGHLAFTSSNGSNGIVTAPGERQATSVPTITLNAPIVSTTAGGLSSSGGGMIVPPHNSTASSVSHSALIKTVTTSVPVSSSTNGHGHHSVPVSIGNLSTSNPLPIEIVARCHATTNGDSNGILQGKLLPAIVENEDVMWSASANGPAVIVESANAVPVTYIETVDAVGAGNAAAAFTTANLESIEYDYLYPVGNGGVTTNAIEVRERQLDFCML